ncbi:hypothetical protein KDL29_15335 [bacterium]|nr:hypothetical protein [bacterium]
MSENTEKLFFGRKELLWISLACIALSCIGAVWMCVGRIEMDRSYRTVAVLVDWQELASLPDASGASISYPEDSEQPWQLLAALPGAQLCYGEETVGSLLDSGIFAPAELATGAPAYEVTDERYSADIARGASRHGYPYRRVARFASGYESLVVQFPAMPEEDLRLLPVAWFQSVQDAAALHGASLILRPGGSEFLGDNGLQETMGFIAKQPLVLFQGPTVLGYPGRLDEVADAIKRNGQTFCWVEFDEQDGGNGLAHRMHGNLGEINLARLHSIPPEEMDNYDIAGAVARYLRAVDERSMRVLYIRPFIRGRQLNAGSAGDTGYVQRLLELNRSYFQTLASELQAEGFSIGKKPIVLASNAVKASHYWMLPGLLGIMLLILLLSSGLSQFNETFFRAVGLCYFLLAMLLILYPDPRLIDLCLLAIAIAFPLVGFWLAMHVYMYLTTRLVCRRFCPRRIFIALLGLTVASLFSIAGGVIIHGTLASAEGILKLSEFRGVTLSMALPVLLFAAWGWQAETLADAWQAAENRLVGYWQRFSTLWQSPIRYGDVAFILIAMGIIGVVLLRSGNDSLLGVLSIENLFREGLEQSFGVRPRTKELIGHPLLMLFLLSIAWRTRVSVMLGIGALLGQISILNTFCHLHTPLELTVTRVLLGLGLGAATGLIWCVLAIAIGNMWEWWKRRSGDTPVADA